MIGRFEFWFWRFGFAKETMRERKGELFIYLFIFMTFVDDNDIDLLYGIDKNLKLKNLLGRLIHISQVILNKKKSFNLKFEI